jgi:DNA polymerase-3 subunit beta
MQFVIEKGLFQTCLGKIQGIAERRSTIPILSNILISGSNDDIRIVATDLEIGVMEIVNVEKAGQGDICIPARKLYDIVKELSEERVEVKGGENFWVSIKAGKTLFNLPGLDPKDFPSFPLTEDSPGFNIGLTDLLEMIEKTAFAASSEESRFNLNGIYIEKAHRDNEEFFRMVATDGHRLSMIEKTLNSILAEKGIIISRRGLTEVKRILGHEEETEVVVSLQGNNCVFKTERTVVVVRLLEGEYPDYQQVIPADNDKHINVDRKALIGALRRAHVIASEKGEGVKFSIQGGVMEIKTGGPDVGNIQEEIKIDYDGEPLEVSFNARYLLDVLNIMDTEQVRVELKQELSSGVIRPLNGENYLYVIMPMRL